MTHAPRDNVLCVKVEQDLDQCKDEKIINSGYLAYNVYGHFKILAIWSYGSDNCLDAKKNSVGFFNRVDKIWKFTSCTHTHSESISLDLLSSWQIPLVYLD